MKMTHFLDLAERFVNTESSGNETYDHGLRNGFVAGYTAAREMVEGMLKSIQENKRFNDPSVVTPPTAEMVLREVLERLKNE